VQFLQSAFELGFQSFRFGINDFGAEGGERKGYILERGRTQWEIRLLQGDERVMWAYVTGFSAASLAVVDWLSHDKPLASIVELLAGDLVHRPNDKASIWVKD